METEPIMSKCTFKSILHPVHKKPPESQFLQTQSTRLVDVNQDLFCLHQIAVDPVELLVLKVRTILKGKKITSLTVEFSHTTFSPNPHSFVACPLPSNYPS